MSRPARSFFARPSTDVAPELLGLILARRLSSGEILRARVMETEAYEQDDPASHAYRGRTARNAVMFGPAGHLYVYFTYGMHHCMNVVTRTDGHGSAVLLRAAQPIEGIEAMRRARGTDRVRDLCRGPARLAQAFGVDRSLDGTDLVDGDNIWMERARISLAATVLSGPRIGIREGVDRPWRYRVDGPWVSSTPRMPAPSRRSS